MTGVLKAVFDVFTAISGWFAQTIPNVSEMFYNSTEASLTFMGTLAVASLGVSVVFLLIGVISNFLHFRG